MICAQWLALSSALVLKIISTWSFYSSRLEWYGFLKQLLDASLNGSEVFTRGLLLGSEPPRRSAKRLEKDSENGMASAGLTDSSVTAARMLVSLAGLEMMSCLLKICLKEPYLRISPSTSVKGQNAGLLWPPLFQAVLLTRLRSIISANLNTKSKRCPDIYRSLNLVLEFIAPSDSSKVFSWIF